MLLWAFVLLWAVVHLEHGPEEFRVAGLWNRDGPCKLHQSEGPSCHPSDFAHIVGLLVSLSMHRTSNTRGLWAAQVSLSHSTSTSQHALLPHWPASSHSRRGSCGFVTLECFGLAFCLVPLHKLWHISHPQESLEWRESTGHPHQACMQQYRLALPFTGYTTRPPIICGPS